jgi:hypothetical protein
MLVAAESRTGSSPARDAHSADAAKCASMYGKRFGEARVVATMLARAPFHVYWMNSPATENVEARRLAADVDRYFRLFMVPGMVHGPAEIPLPDAPALPGPNLIPTAAYDAAEPLAPDNDALTALQRWVEQGVPPTHFDVRVGVQPAGISPRGVRACLFPRVAACRGEGDPMRAENWTCGSQ